MNKKKSYLINNFSKGIMSDYIEIQATSSKQAAEKYLKTSVKRLYYNNSTYNAQISVREGIVENGQDIFKFGASLFLYMADQEKLQAADRILAGSFIKVDELIDEIEEGDEDK